MARVCVETPTRRPRRLVLALGVAAAALVAVGCGTAATGGHSPGSTVSGPYSHYLRTATVLKRLTVLLPNAGFTVTRADAGQASIAPRYPTYGSMVVVVLKRGYVFRKDGRNGGPVLARTVHEGWIVRHSAGHAQGYCQAVKLYPPNVGLDLFAPSASAKGCRALLRPHWRLADEALSDVVHPLARASRGYLSEPTVLKELNRLLPGEAFRTTVHDRDDTVIKPSYQTYGEFSVHVLKPGTLPGALIVGNEPVTPRVHTGNYKPYGAGLRGGLCDAVKLYGANVVVAFVVGAPDARHCRVPHSQQWQGIDQALTQVVDLPTARRSGSST